jgi:hypothetical protein
MDASGLEAVDVESASGAPAPTLNFIIFALIGSVTSEPRFIFLALLDSRRISLASQTSIHAHSPPDYCHDAFSALYSERRSSQLDPPCSTQHIPDLRRRHSSASSPDHLPHITATRSEHRCRSDLWFELRFALYKIRDKQNPQFRQIQGQEPRGVEPRVPVLYGRVDGLAHCGGRESYCAGYVEPSAP